MSVEFTLASFLVGGGHQITPVMCQTCCNTSRRVRLYHNWKARLKKRHATCRHTLKVSSMCEAAI
jgi:hypothetical protein